MEITQADFSTVSAEPRSRGIQCKQQLSTKAKFCHVTNECDLCFIGMVAKSSYGIIVQPNPARRNSIMQCKIFRLPVNMTNYHLLWLHTAAFYHGNRLNYMRAAFRVQHQSISCVGCRPRCRTQHYFKAPNRPISSNGRLDNPGPDVTPMLRTNARLRTVRKHSKCQFFAVKIV